MSKVTDFSLITLRITWQDHQNKLTSEQRELLRAYSVRTWEERTPVWIMCFELASYRLDEILRKDEANG